MPKTKINYQLGKIYKLVDNTNSKCFIGRTCEPTLAIRLAKHLANYKSIIKNNSNHNVTSSHKIIENGDYYIELLESYPCNSKAKLHARKRYWINRIDCVNIVKQPGLWNQLGRKDYGKQRYEENKDYFNQYYEVNKDELKEYKKQHYLENKNEIKEKNRRYNEENKDETREYKKQYYLENKNEIKEKNRRYYEENKMK